MTLQMATFERVGSNNIHNDLVFFFLFSFRLSASSAVYSTIGDTNVRRDTDCCQFNIQLKNNVRYAQVQT